MVGSISRAGDCYDNAPSESFFSTIKAECPPADLAPEQVESVIGQRTHPFGALVLATQVALGLYELHRDSVIHGGLAPRCIRLNPAQTLCKIVDFEFATPTFLAARTSGELAGYPLLIPPERWASEPVSTRQDVYQLGNLLLTGAPAVSERFFALFPRKGSELIIEEPDLQQRVTRAVLGARLETGDSVFGWLSQRLAETSTPEFITQHLAPLLSSCLAPRPELRPSLDSALSALIRFGVLPHGLRRPIRPVVHRPPFLGGELLTAGLPQTGSNAGLGPAETGVASAPSGCARPLCPSHPPPTASTLRLESGLHAAY